MDDNPEPKAGRRAIAYARVSTDEQGASGAGIDAQLATIASVIESKSWTTVAAFVDIASGGTLSRPKLTEAMSMIEAREADAFVVARLDRATRSVGDFAVLLERIESAGGVFVACDIGVDTSTPGGRLVANVIASVAEWERSTIRERTKAAMRALPRERRNGRPCYSEEVRQRARHLRACGLTLHQVGQTLLDEGVVPPRGGRSIHASAVRRLLHGD